MALSGVPIPVYALGDSVMLGAAAALAERGVFVDALMSRAFVNGLDQIVQLRTHGLPSCSQPPVPL
jgi:hypothetical protein